jgi:hypothetical protein
MNPEEKNLLDLARHHAARVADNLDEAIADLQPIAWLSSDDAQPSKSERYVIDGFLKRFSDAAEAGRRLFRASLIPLGENDPKLSFIDVLNKAEKFHVLTDARAWRDAVEIRNKVVHEYAMQRDEARAAVGEAHRAAQRVSEMLRHALARAAELAGKP